MAKFSGTAYVARTSYDQTHVNRLCVPEFGVVEIRRKKNGLGSLSHRLPSVSTPRVPTGAGTNSFNFAPGPQYNPVTWVEDAARDDLVKIWYDLHNPLLNITKARLEIFSRFDKTAIWERDLKDQELEDGAHELEFDFQSGGTAQKRKLWDGSINSGGSFPDGFLTVDHSPYKLRITVEGPGQCQAQMAWTYFHVIIDHLKLEWGPEAAIPSSKVERRQPFHDLLNPRGGAAKPTPETAAIPVYLNSALFMSRGWFHDSSSQMFDNTLFKKYKSLWSDGPEVPVFCQIWIRDSSGNPVIAPKAIGKTKFLWDWESRSAAGASAFVNDAQNYDVAATRPPGQNCHKDRGGKRGSDTAVFPEQGGYSARAQLKAADFPFKVEQCPTSRTWAAYSYAWREQSLAAKTGILFQPSRMAGDKVRITVYAAHETPDGKTPRLQVNTVAPLPLPIDASLKTISGDFEIWRRVPLIRYIKKTAAVTSLTFATIAAYYQPAFLDLVDDSGGASVYPAADWNKNAKDAISDWPSKFQLMVDPAVDQYLSGNDGLSLRSRAQFRAALVATGVSAVDATTWMNNNAMSNVVSYAQTAEGLTRQALVKIFDKKFRSDIPGVNISQVAVVHNLIGPALAAGLPSMVDGEAADYPSSDENHSAFLSLLDPTQRGVLGFVSTSEITAAHEFGHLFFLPHPAPVNGESGYNAHDTTPGVNNCVMSYWAGPRVFCGLCQLRLRGWDKSALKITMVNHKP
jgi:hypothetical protein